MALRGQWLWAYATATESIPKAGEVFSVRHQFVLKAAPRQAGAVATADNSFTVFVNGTRVKSGDNWGQPESMNLTSQLRAGTNEILIVARNGGDAPNPAGVYFEARLSMKDGSDQVIATDGSWEGTLAEPDAKGKFKAAPEWQPAVALTNASLWMSTVASDLKSGLARATFQELAPVRASLMKSDLLMRTLGRPNREQIVSTRPNDLTTLEAIDLANGPGLASMLERAAANLVARSWKSPDDLTQWVYRSALARPAGKAELTLARETLGPQPSPGGVQDLLWAVVMLPEFQLIR